MQASPTSSRARVVPPVRQSASVELHLIGAEQLSAQRRLIIDAIRAGLLGAQAVWQGGRRSEIRSAARIRGSSCAYDNR